MFKVRAGHYLEILTPGTMELLGCTINKITKNENGKKMLIIWKFLMYY